MNRKYRIWPHKCSAHPSYRPFRCAVRSSFVFANTKCLLLVEIKHVIYFSQSQLLLSKTNEDQTACRNALYEHIRHNKFLRSYMKSSIVPTIPLLIKGYTRNKNTRKCPCAHKKCRISAAFPCTLT